MYKVIKTFVDLQDKNHVYYVGDEFPHDDREVSLERQAELAGNKNKIGEPLIIEIKENKPKAEKPKKKK